MSRLSIAVAATGAVGLLAIAGSGSVSAATRADRGGDVIPGHYIVVFKHSVDRVSAKTDALERRAGFESDLRYRHALEGFSAELSRSDVKTLRRDPAVDFVSPDRRVEALGDAPLVPGEPTPPTGVRRILAATDTSARQESGASVAVIDTGIQLSHPDLNAADGTNCVSPGSPAEDGNGHGTHVAGTIAGRNNGAGVVGVAPDTKVYAVKVLNNSGSGTDSQVACGIDWVTAHADALGIGVANMSLGGGGPPIAPCSTTADVMHLAICDSTAAGVTYVVAAGNSDWDFDFAPVPDTPAAYPQVLTVTALSDSDGLPGGNGGPPSCRFGELDDNPASFSNYAATAAGRAHSIAAPGVCIRSTWLGSSYNTISGTSMASPHMAGLVALCLNEGGVDGPCASKTPAEVIAKMRSDAESHTTDDPGYGFARDPLHSPAAGVYYGFLALPASADIAPAPTPTPEPPTQDSLPVITGSARHGQVLAASSGAWSGAAPIEYSYRWRRCDAGGASCIGITGATHRTRRLIAADVGHRLRVVVTARNAAGSASATSAASALVAAVAPAEMSAPRVLGRATTPGSLRGSLGGWSGTRPLDFSFRWRRCDPGPGGRCVSLPGATGRTRRLASADVGHRLRVVVTAKNAAGSARAVSRGSRVVRAPRRR